MAFTSDGANATSSGFWRASTAAMTPEELLHRQIFYGCLIAVLGCCLIAVASIVVEKKRGWPCCESLAACCRIGRQYQSLPDGSESTEGADTTQYITTDLQKDSEGARERGRPLLQDPKVTPEQERAAVLRVLQKEDAMRNTNKAFINLRYTLLCVLFFLYVACSLGLPTLNAGGASCANGFFWEDHLPFLILFLFTKLMELLFYSFDPTIVAELDWCHFMLKFFPSILGYVDAYTDATAIVITQTCQAEGAAVLAKWMIFFYVLGVIAAQWMGALYMACQDETHACFMKLIHWDVCASSIALPEKHKNAWIAVNVARTFLEDIPQAVLQSIFLIKIKPNPLMLLSVVIGVLSSIKGVFDAIQRGVAAASELAKALQEQRRQGDSENPPPETAENPPPETAENPPPETAERRGVRIDFEDSAKGIHTFNFEERPIGIVFSRRSPIKVDDFFRCNSLAKQMGVQKGWVIVRIGDQDIQRGQSFDVVQQFLTSSLRDLAVHPLEIDFLTDSQGIRTIKSTAWHTGFQWSSTVPPKVVQVTRPELKSLGIEPGWVISRVAEHNITPSTSRKEVEEWLSEAIERLPPP